jgi:hypothetical protein
MMAHDMRMHEVTFIVDGLVLHCVGFESKQELEAYKAARTIGAARVDSPPRVPLPNAEPVRRGRPAEYTKLIAAAVATLSAADLNPRLELRERGRRVLKKLAQTCAPAEMPSRDTVERYLRGKKNCIYGSKIRRVRRLPSEA